jgi:eukaryotic-like serine/threonine-protein kinase
VQSAVAAGKLVGQRYRLLAPAGRGGMATVWRGAVEGAYGFTRTVAIKQMHPHLAETPLYVDMFVEEARVGASLHEPNIAHVYDLCAEDGHFFMVMEWIEGIDLGSWIRYHNDRGQQTSWEHVTAIMIGLGRALTAAHERRPAPVVHRDVSPHNILISTTGVSKLIDFGLALAFDRTKDLTNPGIVKGKMSYLAPEILAGERPSPKSDQFALGSCLWEALTGHRLFEGANDLEVYEKLKAALIPPLRPLRPDLPRVLHSTIMRALKADPRDRFPTTREMTGELMHVIRSAKTRRDPAEEVAGRVADARAHFAGVARSEDSETPTPEVFPIARDPDRAPEEGRQPIWRRWIFGKR